MRTAVLTLIAVVLAGCSFAPTYDRPAAPIPGSWSAASKASPVSVQSLHWKDFVIDERLRSRIETALANNRDLRQTLLNVQTARAAYRVQRADQLPGLEAQASGNRQRLPADLSGTGAARVQSNYQAGVGLMAFELDLFGRMRSLSEAALMEYLATEETARSVQISLVAEVIQASLAHDSARQRQVLALRTLQARDKEWQLMSERRKTGTAGRLDEQEAQGQLELARAEVERLSRELRQAANALDWLVGDGSVQAAADLSAAPLVQEIGAGLPSDLLELRPDIRAAEYQLRSRNASIGAARAAFFPRISLTGSYGSASAELSDLFAGGQRSWSFMPQLSLPIFDGGRNRANVQVAESNQRIALSQYEKSVQTAFKEVADVLADRAQWGERLDAQTSMVANTQKAFDLSNARFKAGVDNYLTVLDAQRSLYTAQQTLIGLRLSEQLNRVTLWKALGGEEAPQPG
jgi:multidrug efflux system outer membrane protein